MDWHEGFQIYGENGSASAKIYNPWFYKSSDVELFHKDSATTTQVLGADGHFYRRQLEHVSQGVTKPTLRIAHCESSLRRPTADPFGGPLTPDAKALATLHGVSDLVRCE